MALLPTKLTFLFTTTTANHQQTHLSSVPTTSKRSSHHRHRHLHLRPINARRLPSPPPPPSSSSQVYQPFRRPPTPLPEKFRSLSATDRLELLRNRMGLWYEYAPLVSSLLQEGFTPPSIEEVTGITGVEQNRLAVAAQVRDSIVSSGLEPEVLCYFDNGGAELLYEIRLLSVSLRASSARYIVEKRLDAKSANQLARAVKDFPRRRGDNGWECFSASSSGDCLAYSYFRLSREALSKAEKTAALDQAMEAAETEVAKDRILKELKKEEKEEDEEENGVASKVAVPVVRLRYGELTEWTSISVLPVCSSREREGKELVTMAPKSRLEGEFGVVEAEEGWKRWVVLPGWEPLLIISNGVAIEFADAKVLPWKTKRSLQEEAVLVVVDRDRKKVTEEAEFYLVGGGSELKVERGWKLKESEEVEVLGTVVLVVRPQKYDNDDQLVDKDWE